MVPGTTSLSLSVNPLPELDAAGLVNDLDRYPYGCSEQTVSRAMPLLYLSDLGIDPDRLDGGIKERMRGRRRTPREPAVGQWRLRPVVGLWRRQQPVALVLCDRLPAARPREGLRGAGRRAGERRRLPAQHGGQRARHPGGFRPGHGLCPLRAGTRRTRTRRRPQVPGGYASINDFGSPLARAQMGAALAMLGDTRARRRRLRLGQRGPR